MKRRQIVHIALVTTIGVLLIGILYTHWPRNETTTRNQSIDGKTGDCLSGKGEVRLAKNFCAPNFTLETINRKKVELYKNNGKATLIAFWTSWCSNCHQEMDYIEQVYHQYKDKINFLMINLTSSEWNEEDAKHFIKQKKFTLPILLDDRGLVGMKYKVLAVPFNIMVDKNGKITHLVKGGNSELINQALLEASKL